MCVSLESCYYDFVTLFAGRYRKYNSLVFEVSPPIFLKFLFMWCYVIRIILLTLEYHLKTLYYIDVSDISKREEETISVVKWHLFSRWYKIKSLNFCQQQEVTITMEGFGFLKKIKSLNAFLKLITHLIALQSKYAKLEMKMQLAIFLEKYHMLRNFSWIGEPLSVLS